jgi:hypothetical protein
MPPARQATLVALYGGKAGPISKFLKEAQDRVESELVGFERYKLDQIHGTIIGLEHDGSNTSNNNNFQEFRTESRRMDLAGFLLRLATNTFFPFDVKVGGFTNRDYPFTSRGERPFVRSFSLQKELVVIMGWPVNWKSPTEEDHGNVIGRASLTYPSPLDDVRRWAQSFNILHQWHRKSTDVDNDFYFRIGSFDPDKTLDSVKAAVEQNMREWLAARRPMSLTLDLSNLWLALYEDNRLPPDTTKAYRLSELQTEDEITHILRTNGCL